MALSNYMVPVSQPRTNKAERLNNGAHGGIGREDRTYSVGYAIGEANEFYLAVRALPLGVESVKEGESRLLRVGIVVARMNVSESHGGICSSNGRVHTEDDALSGTERRKTLFTC